jgi:alanyl-tRNA synthetase
VAELVDAAADVGYRLVVASVPPTRPQALRALWDALRARGVDAAVLATADADSGKALLLAAGVESAVSAGFDAGRTLAAMALLVGGRGGGKAQMAQGGGEDASGIEGALDAARGLLGVS